MPVEAPECVTDARFAVSCASKRDSAVRFVRWWSRVALLHDECATIYPNSATSIVALAYNFRK